MDDTDNEELRKRLSELGATRLADALAYLSSRTEGGTEYVEALLLTPEEAVKRFKSKLAGLKRRRKYIDWRATLRFSPCAVSIGHQSAQGALLLFPQYVETVYDLLAWIRDRSRA